VAGTVIVFDEFEHCHIQNAKCHPKTRLSRATGQFSSEILTFRGQPNEMIILYCDDGQVSAEAALRDVQRYFDNIFLLHGGLADFAAEYPNLVGPGEPPQRPVSQNQKPTAQSTARPKTRRARPAKQLTRATQAVAARPGARLSFSVLSQTLFVYLGCPSPDQTNRSFQRIVFSTICFTRCVINHLSRFVNMRSRFFHKLNDF
jgi:rhodanese-related sulfurtransferase